MWSASSYFIVGQVVSTGRLCDAIKQYPWDRLTPVHEASASADERGRKRWPSSTASSLEALRRRGVHVGVGHRSGDGDDTDDVGKAHNSGSAGPGAYTPSRLAARRSR